MKYIHNLKLSWDRTADWITDKPLYITCIINLPDQNSSCWVKKHTLPTTAKKNVLLWLSSLSSKSKLKLFSAFWSSATFSKVIHAWGLDTEAMILSLPQYWHPTYSRIGNDIFIDYSSILFVLGFFFHSNKCFLGLNVNYQIKVTKLFHCMQWSVCCTTGAAKSR